MDDEEEDDEIFTLDDEKFKSKFKEIIEEQERVKIWVEPYEDKLKLFIQNGSSSKKMVAIIQFEQFKQLQHLGVNSTVDKIREIIPDIDPNLAKQLNTGLIQIASQNHS